MAVESLEPHAHTSGTRHSRRYLRPLLALLIALPACLYLLKERPPAVLPQVKAPVPPKTVTVQRGSIEQTVSADGKLQLFHYVDLNAQVSGDISDVAVSVGDDVKTGKLLIKIVPNVSMAHMQANQAQLAQLQAELSEQQAQSEFAELQFKRQTLLKADNATREETFESSRAAMESAVARIEAIKARIQETMAATKDDEEARKHTDIVAPFTGTIVALSARSGQPVTAHQQTQPLVEIADLSKLTVQARVAEINLPRLHKGIAAYFTTPGYPDQRWSGTVRQIVPVPASGSADQSKQTFYNVLFEVGNPDHRLLSGMSAKIRFVLAHADNVATISSEALGKADDSGIYHVNVLLPNHQTQKREVHVGLRGQDRIQVVSGLAPDEQVIVDTQATGGKNAATTPPSEPSAAD